ncbi:hypothetical protein Peur_005068 [Populus x canadensis]
MVASVSVKSGYHFEKERLEARPLLTSEESWWNFIWKLHIIPEILTILMVKRLGIFWSNVRGQGRCGWRSVLLMVARINYPDKGEVNINTNVAIFGMEKIGLGVAMLDDKGEVMLTASKPVDPLFAVEVGGAFAAQHGLLLATDTGCAVLF